MRTLEDVVIKMDQINDFMYAVEGAMLDTATDESNPAEKRFHSLFYLLMDQLRFIQEDLEEVNGHIMVCNAILASAHVREMEAELKELRGKISRMEPVPATLTADNLGGQRND